MNHRKYTYKERPAEIDPQAPRHSKGQHVYKVPCRRRESTSGILTVKVRADSPEEAAKIVEEGRAPAIGLGFRAIRDRIQRLPDDEAAL